MTVRFAFTDLAGVPSDSLMEGSRYNLLMYVRDSRSAPTGVRQAYFDVLYDQTLISAEGDVEAGIEYQQDSSGDTSTAGLIDEAGGADSDATPPVSAGAELLLLSVPISAKEAGTLNLAADLSELTTRLPKFFQSDIAVELGNIDFVGRTIDIIEAGIIIVPTAGLQTTELGGTASFQVSLRTAPSSNVTIGLSSSDSSEGTVAPASVTFTPANWNVPQTVTAQGVDDARVDGNISYQIVTAAAVSSDSYYSGRNAEDVAVTNLDNDAAGITVQPTSGETSEAGASDTFQIVLDSQPTAAVTIALSSSDTSEGTVDRESVTFTPEDWDSPRTITVTGQDDQVADGNQIFLLVTGAAVSDDPEYNGRDVADVSITNLDNDTAGISVQPTTGQTTEAGGTASFEIVLTSEPLSDVTIQLASSDTTEGTVLPSSVVFTALNWNAPQSIIVTGQNDDVADGNTSYSIITSVATSADAAYNNRAVADIALTNVDNDSAGILVAPTTGQTTESGETATFSITLTSRPSADVTIGLSSSDTSEGTVAPGSITITPDTWNTPRQVTVTGIDDAQVDGNIAYTIVTAPAVSSDLQYQGRDAADISLTNRDNDSYDITIEPIAGETTEAGATASFSIVLSSRPTANVTVNLSSSDESEGTVTPASVVFTPDTWNQLRTIVVQGQDDLQRDGDVAYSIVTSNATSDDPNFNNRNVDNISLTNKDDEISAVIVTPTAGLSTSEAGQTATFTVRLASGPSAEVTLDISSSDVTEGTLAPTTLSFTLANWDQPQVVTVTGVDDNIDDGDMPYTIVTGATASDDTFYDNLTVDDVQVVNIDNDSAAILISPTAGLVTSESGGQATFTVVLTSQPTSDVIISLTSNDETEGALQTDELTFTPVNWNTPREVRVAGVNDAWVDGDRAYTITAQPSSLDTTFDNLAPLTISAVNQDDDSAQLVVSTSGATVVEGTGTTNPRVAFTVELIGAVEGGFSLAVATSDGTASAAGGDYVAATDSLAFEGVTRETHTVEIEITADNMLEPDETFLVSLGAISGIPGSAAARIETVGTPLEFTILDDDEAAISFFPVSLPEGTGSEPTVFAFQVVLSNPVQGGLTIQYTTNDGTATLAGGDYVDNDGLLEFAGTGGEQHPINVLVNADSAVERDETFMVTLETITFLDPALNDAIVAEGGSQTGTILNDDTAAISFVNSSSLVIETGGRQNIDARLSVTNGGTLTEDVVVEVVLLPGATATTPDDFILSNTTLTFPAGSQDGDLQSVIIDVVDDEFKDPNETLTLEMQLVSGDMDGNVSLGAISQDNVRIFEDPTTASIAGMVWLDTNGNGRQDQGELPIPGVFVTLAGIDLGKRPVEIVTMTDAQGAFLFDLLPGGTYSVSESQPSAFTDGVDVLGTILGETVGELENDRFANIVLPPEFSARNYNFGELRLAQPPISARMFFASAPSLHEVIGEVVARAEEKAGNTAQADAIRAGESVEMRRIGNRVTLTGTSLDDVISFAPAGNSEQADSSQHYLAANGFEWYFAASEIFRFVIDGSDGDDQIDLGDSPLDENLAASHDQAILSSSDFRLDATALELVRAISTSGGTDTVSREDLDFILRLEGPWINAPL